MTKISKNKLRRQTGLGTMKALTDSKVSPYTIHWLLATGRLANEQRLCDLFGGTYTEVLLWLETYNNGIIFLPNDVCRVKATMIVEYLKEERYGYKALPQNMWPPELRPRR